MTASPFSALRRRLARGGARAASASWPELRNDTPGRASAPARIVEPPFAHRPVGEPVPWDEDVAFLDGSQHVELVGYLGTEPLVAAIVRSALRTRHDRRTRVAVEQARRLVIARADVLAQLGPAIDGHVAIAIGAGENRHPLRDLERAHAAVDSERTAVEAAVVRQFRVSSDSWIIADGSLAVSPEWTSDPRMIGVVRSHGAVPLDGAELDLYLTVPAFHRTSVFAPESQRLTPLHAWGLRLRPWDGRDLLHGLVRVETAATDDMLRQADTISRHLLAERTPVTSAPRGDRTLYGIHDVARYLRVAGGAG